MNPSPVPAASVPLSLPTSLSSRAAPSPAPVADRAVRTREPERPAPASTSRAPDRLELSKDAVAMRSRTAPRSSTGNPEIRPDLVARLRADLASGAYDADARLDSVLDRILDDLDI